MTINGQSPAKGEARYSRCYLKVNTEQSEREAHQAKTTLHQSRFFNHKRYLLEKVGDERVGKSAKKRSKIAKLIY